MNKNETLALHRSGREKWKAWAEARLAEKTKIEAAGGSLTEWEKSAQADFQNRKFDRKMDFSGYIFPGKCRFDGSTFPAVADFDQAVFHDGATFERVIFKELATFRSACFRGIANFTAIQAESSFDLSNTRFRTSVPNFIQAHFPEAPRFDHVHVPTVPQLRRVGTKIEPLTTARYRALKRLAIQGHDHDRELQFFADELRSQQGAGNAPRNLFIALYGWFSDFGRSLARPLTWWFELAAFCGGVYLGTHDATATVGSASHCVNGDGSPLWSAIYLTLRKALVFPGFSQDTKLDQAYACLYGTSVLFANGDEHARVIPHIPDVVAYFGVFQTVTSAVLIFLFLLAVRNHFRIK